MNPLLLFLPGSLCPDDHPPDVPTLDPVQRAILSHTLSLLAPPRKHTISCSVCRLCFNSDRQAEGHYQSNRHAKKMKIQEETQQHSTTPSSSSSSSPSAQNIHRTLPPSVSMTILPSSGKRRPLSASAPPPSNMPQLPLAMTTSTEPPLAPVPASTESCGQSEEEKAKKLLYCSLCKVAVNSQSQLQAHNTGLKHKTLQEARSGAGPIRAYPRTGAKLRATPSALIGSGLQNKTFHCQVCDVHVNSEIQLKQHISSRRHKERGAGRPPRPRFSPYTKQLATPQVGFQKDPAMPTLPSLYLPQSILSLLSPHTRPNALLPPPGPPAPFLPPPGPITTTPMGSIIFSPY